MQATPTQLPLLKTIKYTSIHVTNYFFSATGKGLGPTAALKIAPQNKITLSFVTNCWLQPLQQGGHAGRGGQSAGGIAVVLEFLLLFFQEKRRIEKIKSMLMKTLVSANFFISCHNGFTMALMACICYSKIILYHNRYKQHQPGCHC